jgi:hypothetical protein
VRKVELRIALGQNLFRFFALGDVNDSANHSHGASAVVGDQDARLDPPNLTVGRDAKVQHDFASTLRIGAVTNFTPSVRRATMARATPGQA